MKLIKTKEMKMEFIPKFRKLLEDSDNKIKIAHVVTVKPEYEVIKKLIDMYENTIQNICNDLNIEYEMIFINDDPFTIPTDIRLIVNALNKNNTVHGIIIDYPFITNIFRGFISHLIDPAKDIALNEDITDNFNQKYNHKHPFRFIIDYMMMKHLILDEMISYKIITNNSNSYRGIIPSVNFGHNRYTFITNLFIDRQNFDDDIIVSIMTNTPKVYSSENTIVKDPKLIIDFGYQTNGEIHSIDRSLFNDQITPIYTWDNGLLDMYVYAMLNNLIENK